MLSPYDCTFDINKKPQGGCIDCNCTFEVYAEIRHWLTGLSAPPDQTIILP
jgi:hypothetical protein